MEFNLFQVKLIRNNASIDYLLDLTDVRRPYPRAKK